jgi:uncharacterized repeat protein (TIGR01451 family)
MKKRRISGICLIIALLMVVPTFTVGANGGQDESLVVVKEVFDGEGWVKEIEAELDDIVQFRITITYYNITDPEGTHWAKDIVVNDTLPPCLEYIEDSAQPEEPEIYDNYLVWDLGDIILEDGESYIITFNASVVDYGENVNEVNVTAKEHCTDKTLYGEDDATVIVEEEPEPEPGIDVNKEVWDAEDEKWVKEITACVCTDLTFRINVSNTGNTALPDVILKDYLPSFLTYNYDATGSPTVEQDQYIEWHLGTIDVDQYVIVTFSAHVDEEGEDVNTANVTSCTGVTDEDYVSVLGEVRFKVVKKVWNGTGWDDHLDFVKKSEPVRFRIEITYCGNYVMKCMLVGDNLPTECLEYADNEEIWINDELITEDHELYPDIYVLEEGEELDFCGEIIIIPEDTVLWDWRNVKSFGLESGDTVIIEFDANVTEYCWCEVVENCVQAVLWGCGQCHPCAFYYSGDCVDIYCNPPPTRFDKKVLDGNEWVDEIETMVGSTLTFKLELEYYGEENLTEIQFFDILPCVLEYVEDSATINGEPIDPEISEDGKTLWFNLTSELSDGDIITIEFDAIVTEVTGDCCGECECVNYAEVIGYYVGCPPEPPEDFPLKDEVPIVAESNCPPDIPDVEGPTTGEVGDELSYQTVIHDPDGDQVYYKFNWGDSETDWLGPVDSDDPITETYSWDVSGTYLVKVKAKDIHGAESNWTDFPLEVVITEPEPELKICFKRFSIKSVTAIITNKLGVDLTDAEWNMTIKGGLFGGIDAFNNGTITLEPGASVAVSTCWGGFLPKFGRITAEINVVVPGYPEPFTTVTYGFVIGRFVITGLVVAL